MLNPKTGLLPNKNLSIHIDSLQFLFLFKISKSKKKERINPENKNDEPKRWERPLRMYLLTILDKNR